MSIDALDSIVVEPQGEPRAAVIWLHGLGADGHDFEPIVPELGIAPSLGVRFVFPHAPNMPVTLNGGMIMPSWYDIAEADLERRHDEPGIRKSSTQVARMIQDQIDAGIASEKIVLAGFSQGGAIALFEGLRQSHQLAGIMALSTYLVCVDALSAERNTTTTDVPIFQAHGSHDPMVSIDRGRAAHAQLEAWGYSVQFESYPMQHQVCQDELNAIGIWLNRVLHG